ncbi:limonene-1,2-epoxide hydrolase family protein [Hyphomonas sp.]|uniref:limonene-1,2-epoxide hydrolase family protein n=1 Tax=Hyphomonas sp. TaxID=87 RepID=UPI0037C0E814
MREHADGQGHWPGRGARGAGGVLLATGWAELPAAGVWVVENRRITFWREYFDAATIFSK